MCGIYGVVALKPGFYPDSSWLDSMGEVTRHRGPDDSGTFCSEGIIMGMRRLSIIDVDGGHQPISNADNSIQVICNGEIFNFLELRSRLEKLGKWFKTGSDSEVLVHLYEIYGEDLVHHLDGMFAFAIWDQRNKKLVLGRDRIGIKPLYFFVDDNKLVFASEIKSILKVPGVIAEIDYASLDQLLELGYSPSPYTMFKGVRKIDKGSILICKRGEVSKHRYWQFTVSDEDLIEDEETCLELLRGCLEKSVVNQMISDVPLGAFLSGGVDSSGVVAYMARNSSTPVKTYSIGFDTGPAGQYYNELPYARQVSKLFGTDHHEIMVRPDIARLLPRLIWHMDEPMADSALLTTYLVAEFARKDVTVILSGAGGDELFGGYRRYLGAHYHQLFNRVPGIVRRNILRPIARALPSDRHGALRNLVRYARQFIVSSDLPEDQRYKFYVGLFSILERQKILVNRVVRHGGGIEDAFGRISTRDSINALMQVDFDTQLPDDILLLTDKMTMAASVECRVPLLSNDLVDLALRMPGHLKVRGPRLKYLLKKAMSGVVPASILERPKRGFGAPMGAWIKKELKPMVNLMLSKELVEFRGLFDPTEVSRAIALHESGKEDYSNHLQLLVNFEIWCQIYMDGKSPDDVGEMLSESLGNGSGS